MTDSPNWATVYPELLLLGMACVIALFDLVVKTPLRGSTYRLTLLTLGVVAVLEAMLATSGEILHGFGGMVVSDPMGAWLKCFASLAMMVTLVYGRPYAGARDMLRGGEFFTLSMFALLGMFVMISGHSFLMIYMGLELLTLSSYALVALRRDDLRASEAAMKYFVLGALASGFLLYGLSLVYGASGSIDLATIAAHAAGAEQRTMLLTGMAFMLAGIAFKFGAAPFHMWVPDVYQGAPTPITLFIGSAPKLAAFAMAMRLLEVGMGPLGDHWRPLLAILAALSLVIGNLVALAQTNLKRMLAYSTVSHVGFLFMGLAGGGAIGYAAAMFYALGYTIMATAAFGAIILLSRRGFEADRIEDFKGLNARDPWTAGLVLCVMASLAGVPPFLGFWSKLVVLRAAIEGGMLWLAIVGIVCAVIGAFYYLRVIKAMYFDEPVGEPVVPRADRTLRVVFGVNALALLAFGVFWSPFMAWCQQAFA